MVYAARGVRRTASRCCVSSRWGSAAPRAGVRVSPAAGCAERTIWRSPAVTTTQPTRLLRTWQRTCRRRRQRTHAHAFFAIARRSRHWTRMRSRARGDRQAPEWPRRVAEATPRRTPPPQVYAVAPGRRRARTVTRDTGTRISIAPRGAKPRGRLKAPDVCASLRQSLAPGPQPSAPKSRRQPRQRSHDPDAETITATCGFTARPTYQREATDPLDGNKSSKTVARSLDFLTSWQSARPALAPAHAS